MGVNSLPKTVTRQRPGCDLNPGPSVLESSTLTNRLPSHPVATLRCDLSLITTFLRDYYLFSTINVLQAFSDAYKVWWYLQ